MIVRLDEDRNDESEEKRPVVAPDNNNNNDETMKSDSGSRLPVRHENSNKMVHSRSSTPNRSNLQHSPLMDKSQEHLTTNNNNNTIAAFPPHTTTMDSSSYQHSLNGEGCLMVQPMRCVAGGSRSKSVVSAMSVQDPTAHAQTFLLALAFLAVWSPQNIMAPNLTQMANYFNFSASQRDWYLGANIAFATGVLSLPVSALIGFVADIVPSRKRLFALTVFLGGVSSLCTGASTTYTQLYCSRFVCGGCMSGSVPVAFSLLGDLFDTRDRNAASSGLTAMMGAGIILGQVYAGVVGDSLGWKHPFTVSAASSILTSLMVLRFVREPIRGGKERVLQDMIANGTRYERKLTWVRFYHAMTRNRSNILLLSQGFFTSIPWGIIFTFLNDYLSQEVGMTVPDATLLVLYFGIGCAVGGLLGGYLGTLASSDKNRLHRLPLFMSATTFLGIVPFLGLLNGRYRHATLVPSLYAFFSGCIANLPSVNVRPCLLNVNPPETRSAALTAANLMINFARGAGPSVITMMGTLWNVDRQFSFNITLVVFWTITSVQLLVLATTLPGDQDAMETDLASYAESALRRQQNDEDDSSMADLEEMTQLSDGIVSIEDRMTSFDVSAAQESLTFMGDALREMMGSDEWSGRRRSSSRRWSTTHPHTKGYDATMDDPAIPEERPSTTTPRYSQLSLSQRDEADWNTTHSRQQIEGEMPSTMTTTTIQQS